MNTFWLKIAALVIIIIIGVVLLANFLSSGIEEATDFERVEKLVEAQEARFQAELAEAELKAKQAKQAKAKGADVKQPAAQPEPPQPQIEEIEELQQNLQAQKLYQWAETEFRIARKPLMSYKRCVDFCRQIIQRWPDSAEAAKARVLLRRIPERYRKQYNITDEEMGISS
jgi:flagellar basal body-associated protein FliL